MHYNTFKKLSYMKKAGIDVSKEFASRLKNMNIIPELKGINNEELCYFYTDDLIKSISNIVNFVKNTDFSKSSYSETVLLNSYHSATIEGAKTTVLEVKSAVKNKNFTKDSRMVYNVIVGTDFAINHGVNIEEDYLRLWRFVVDGVCENINVQGNKYRKGMVYVSSLDRVVHTPEKPENITLKMNMFYRYNNLLYSDIGKGVLSALISHFYYVYIHPMCDGNGRVARILMISKLKEYGIPAEKLPIVSEIRKNFSGYYNSLLDSEEVVVLKDKKFIDVTPFIAYMLGILESSLISYDRFSVELSEDERKVISKMFSVGKGAELSVKNCCKILKCNESKARSILNNLCNKGFLLKKKNGTYNLYSLK